MEIKLSHEESERFFLNALCNGLTYIRNYDLALDYDQSAYRKCSKRLRNNGTSPCFEDVLMEILRKGGELRLVALDEFYSDYNYNATITLETIRERVQKAPLWAVMQMVNEEDDANTADAIIQWVAYEEIIFG